MRPFMILVSVVFVGLMGAARADTCAVPSEMKTYHKPDTLPDKGTRCDMKNGKCVKVELKGRLYVPDKTKHKGPYPLIVYNHGSGQKVGDMCYLGEYFTAKGYVVFMPHRRGHGDSTGVTLAEYTDKNKSWCSTPGDSGFCKMEYLHKQVDDIEDAIKYMKGRETGGTPLVDSDRIAIMGHSFGGIVTVFSNEKDLGQRAVVDAAGASQSWVGNDDARKAMKDAVKKAVAPIFFFEPMNDASIDPTIELSKIAGDNCLQYQATLFPAVDANGDGKITKADYAADWDDDGNNVDPRNKAHGATMTMTKMYGPAAHEFMTRYFNEPAKFDHLCKGTSNK